MPIPEEGQVGSGATITALNLTLGWAADPPCAPTARPFIERLDVRDDAALLCLVRPTGEGPTERAESLDRLTHV